jgi:hypothetical protein
MEVSSQLHAPAALTPGKEPSGTHWIGVWVGPRAGLDTVVPGLAPLIILSVAQRYTTELSWLLLFPGVFKFHLKLPYIFDTYSFSVQPLIEAVLFS